MMGFRPPLRPALLLALLAISLPAEAQKRYSPGASDTAIRIGQTMPYSGPASSYSVIGKAELAYFAKVNAEGGINGRKVELISLDDGYSPPKTVEQTRRLVEQDKVLAIFSTFGTPTNAVIRKYLNAKKIPHLFPTGGATQWDDPRAYPWMFGWQPNYNAEMKAYVRFLLKERPNARIGILYQDDDVGKDNLKGLREGLGPAAQHMIVREVSYATTDATVDSQVIDLKASGADVFFNTASGKFAAQAIRKAHDLGWHPLQFLSNYSSSVGAVLRPAGLEGAKGIISTQFQKDPTDPRWRDDQGYKEWLSWMDKFYPNGDKADIFSVYGYLSAQTLVEVLKRSGDELTTDSLRKQAESLRGVALPMLLPGITLNTSPDSHAPLKQLYLMRFDGESWQTFGEAHGG
ncbi:ABC transporter substrate-binding protein [Vineibacter terrae]|uniref:ABC transporter substrate-binding protein n=1 Tax=Vineibacter terrae TaxID=2586908 RepID=UPI002E366FDB|nr:ABC transporter substrate-binding protein [Vineibacter terrae]HEX2891526.1 ABC transporter substrate-binding protein [Vineibacter terrae]